MSCLKKLTAVLLSAVLILGTMSFTAAVNAASVEGSEAGASSGTTGDCTWALNNEGVLTVSGEGNMGNYGGEEETPWNKSEIKKIIVKKGVKNIGYSAFAHCQELTDVVLSSTVSVISGSAFYSCDKLSNVDIPLGVKSIDSYAFTYCSSLSALTIPYSVGKMYYAFDDDLILRGYKGTAVEKYADDWSHKFESLGNPPEFLYYDYTVKEDGTAEITGYNGNNKEWIIPSKLDGYTVTSVNYKSYGGYENGINVIEVLTVPESVETIESFSSGNLKKVVLKGDTFPFEYSFDGSDKFTEFVVQKDNPAYTTVDGVLYSKDMSTLVRVPTGKSDYEIPSSVKTIGDDAFSYCNNFTKISIPDSVVKLSNFSFAHCLNLKEVVFGNGLRDLGRMAFRDTGIETIELPNGITSIPFWTFMSWGDRSPLKKVIIPDSVISIDEYAFGGQEGVALLEKIEIPDSVVRLSYFDPFANNIWLRNAPDGIIYAGKVAYCFKMNGEDYSEYNIKDHDFTQDELQKIKQIKIADGTKGITRSVLALCKRFEIDIPDSVLCISDIPYGMLEQYAGEYIEQGADGFRYFKKVACGFEGDCPSELVLRDDTLGIQGYAFANDDNIKIVHIPNQVKYIGDQAFCGCNELFSVDIPDSVETIDAEAFCKCTRLKEVYIPASVKRIGLRAFGYYYTTNEKGYNFAEKIDDFTIYGYHGSAAEDYANYNGFNFVAVDSSPERSGVTGDCEWEIDDNDILTVSGSGHMGTFPQWYKGIKKAIIENGVTNIADNAFQGCAELESVSVTNTVESIGMYAFDGCNSLTSLVIPESVKSIGALSFYDCNGMKGVTIPKSVELIEDYAFGYKNSVERTGDFEKFVDPVKIEGFVIRGCKGTAAQKYAEDNGFTFVPLEDTAVGCGDANGDNKIDVKDVTMIQKQIANIVTLSGDRLKAADTNADGKINITDATHLQKYIAGYPVKLGK